MRSPFRRRRPSARPRFGRAPAHAWLTGAVLTAAMAGCGGSDDGGDAQPAAMPKGPPPAEQVEQAVATILNTCIEASFDESVDTAPVSAQVDKLISLYNAHDPDAELAPSDLKAKTMREALTQVRDQVRDCSPADEDRVNDTLTNPPTG